MVSLYRFYSVAVYDASNGCICFAQRTEVKWTQKQNRKCCRLWIHMHFSFLIFSGLSHSQSQHLVINVMTIRKLSSTTVKGTNERTNKKPEKQAATAHSQSNHPEGERSTAEQRDTEDLHTRRGKHTGVRRRPAVEKTLQQEHEANKTLEP